MDCAQIMAIDGLTSGRGFQIEMAVAEEKEACALQYLEFHQWVL